MTLLSLALLAPVQSAVASPQPTPACHVCGTAFEERAGQYDEDSAGPDDAVNVTRSTVDVHLAANGSARWTARTVLTNASADRLRGWSRLDTFLRETLRSHWFGDPRDLSVHFEGDTLVVTFRVADPASRAFGVLLVDELYYAPGLTYVNAESLRLHPPDGYVPTRVPTGASRTGNGSLVWHGSSAGNPFETTETGGEFAAFAPETTSRSVVRTDLAVAAALAPLVLSQLEGVYPPSLLVTVVALGAYAFLGKRLAGARDPRQVGDAVAGGAGLVAVAGSLALVAGVESALAAVVVLTSVAVAVSCVLGGRGVSTPTRAVGATVSLVFAVAVAATLVGPVAGPFGFLTLTTLAAQPPVVYLLGHATARDSRARWGYRVAPAFLPAVAAVPLLPVGGLGPFFLALVLALWTAVVYVCSTPVYYAGYVLGTQSTLSKSGVE
ncbi:hypothetical protein [Halospeciosus flavus]|uniref:Uncharacterized protein n=1 Tax=Halospeciosus flavus TaxID=3032283 RepID=A0ABD5Z4L8_9EURY|nr:hypothetical protein [Halospeciosus flavus]